MSKQSSFTTALRTIIVITTLCLVTISGNHIFKHKKLETWELEDEKWHEANQAATALYSLRDSPNLFSEGHRYIGQLNEFKALNLKEVRTLFRRPNRFSPQRRQEILQQITYEMRVIRQLKNEEKREFLKIFDFFDFYVLALILMTSVILTLKLSKDFSTDLNLVTQGYDEAGSGNLFVQVPPPHFEELNPVVNGFNQLQKDLQIVQNKLRHKERIESLGIMAAGIAHEMGNPLAAILGYTELIEDQLNEMGKKDLNKITDKVIQCRKIVDDLLLFCHGEESGQKLTTVSLNDIFNSVKEDCARNHEGQIHIHDELERVDINTHGTSVKQIIYNLCTNAFLEGASEVHIRRGSSPENDLRLLVEDNGPGIPSEMANKIFEPFFTTRPAGQGTGLGLSICHGLAKQNGGYLSLTSLKSPTRFELVFPCLS